MERTDKENYYLDIAESVLRRSTCLRLKYGAIIVKNDQILSTGYNGAPRGRANCTDLGVCERQRQGIPSGERYELCRSVHAEANAIIIAPREQMLDGTLYMVCHNAKDELVANTSSCAMCRRLIINAGLSRVIVRDTPKQYRVINVLDWVADDEMGKPLLDI